MANLRQTAGFAASFRLGLAALVLALSIRSDRAAAQDAPGVCTIANTCSEAFFQCVAVNCPAIFDARCSGACRARFNGCMRTGAFRAPDCRDRTLVRK
jgi:hypothetical protein